MSANLLFLYGPSSTGKTSLLQKITETLCGVQSAMMIGSEQIVEEITQSVAQGRFADFFNRYYMIENLLVDNLWILRSRPYAAREIGRLIEARMAHGNLTVLASDLAQQDVISSLPVIGACLKQESAIQLKLFKPTPRRIMGCIG